MGVTVKKRQHETFVSIKAIIGGQLGCDDWENQRLGRNWSEAGPGIRRGGREGGWWVGEAG